MSEHGPQSWVGDWSGRRAALSPDRTGLVDATTGEEFTYAALDRRANRCARLLAEHGVTLGEPTEADGTETAEQARGAPTERQEGRTGARVAVVSRNRPAFLDLFFAAGKTGGVLAPLSHRLAPPELGALLADAAPDLLVVEEPFAEDVAAALDSAALDVPKLSLPVGGEATWERYGAALPDDPTPYEGSALAPADTHLLLHTGGSTGTPKLTRIAHEAVVWNATNTITAWGLRPDDLTPMVFPMFHTGGWNVLTVPLVHMGGTVAIAREFDPGEILAMVEERGATVLVAVPAVLRMMVEHDRWGSTDLSTLRLVKSGGGPCREAVMEAWWDRGVDLSQGYGLTECGPNNFAMPEGWDRRKADTVGVPAMHVDARVVADGEAVPQGEIGELHLRSPHAASGYWERPAATAATFRADTGDGGGAWVATGDLARVDEDGYVSIEGRKKNMYVSGGENVYPAEVEDAVAGHPAVSEVVVVPVDDDQWGQVGKAVVELADGHDEGDLDVDALSSYLDGRLARYKRPRHLAFVDAMPTSGPDKIDRAAIVDQFGE